MSLLLALIQGSTQGETWLELKEDWTSKPPIGTPLRSDGHWSVQGLVGAWGVLEGAGGTTFDSTNNQRHATLAPANLPKWEAGSLGFNGASSTAYSRCSLPNSDYLGGASGATVVCGVTPSTTQASAGGGLVFLSNAASTSATRIFVNVTAQRAINLRCRSGVETQLQLTTADGVVANSKSSVVSAVFDVSGKKQAAYVNSQKILEQTTSFANAKFTPLVSTGCSIGAVDYLPGYAFGGSIHFVWLYNTALSSEQVQSISENPWQVYQPRSRWVKVGTPLPSGVPGYGVPPGLGSSVFVGSPTVKGKGREVVTGLSATATAGTAAAIGTGGSATVSPLGHLTTASVGTVVVKGKGLEVVTGLSATITFGTSIAKGKALKVVSAGLGSTIAAGSSVGKGKGKATPSGLVATFTKNNDIAKGKGTKVVAGLGSTITVGTPVPQETKHYAYPVGKQMTASVGTPAPIKGKGRALVVGVSTGGGGGGCWYYSKGLL